MTLAQIVGVCALGAPLLQLIAMGFIGYPIARRSLAEMERFNRSGLLWWIGVLLAIVVFAMWVAPSLLGVSSPDSAPGWVTWMIWTVGGMVVLLIRLIRSEGVVVV
ncbi:hypothetical protein [Kytococcus sp. Marseille-QA3725]